MSKKIYWKSTEDLNTSLPKAKEEKEFTEELPIVDMLDGESANLATRRRDFLKMLGFSVSAATLAASCEVPVRKAIPYLIKPEEITPGIATWYASTFINGSDYCPVLVKTREGRPIKIEGNKLSSVTQGGTSARAQANILELYNSHRLKGPGKQNTEGKFEEVSWEEADSAIVKAIAAEGANVALLTSSIYSPSTKKAIGLLLEKNPNIRVVSYDSSSYSAILDANVLSYGKRALPDYHFDKAEVIVGFESDFLASWGSYIQYAKGYAKGRKLDKASPEMSRHYQLESRLSITGSNADYRIVLSPSQVGIAIMHLHNKLAGKAGEESISNVPELDGSSADKISELASELWNYKGKSLVVSGINDTGVQLAVNRINRMLLNEGSTLHVDKACLLRQGDDKAFNDLMDDMAKEEVDVLLVYNVNPAYDNSRAVEFAEAIAKVPLSVSLSISPDETSSLCTYNCPDHHGLESWNDAQPVEGKFSLGQPTIRPLFNTRQAQESFLKWAGEEITYYDFLKNNWKQNMLGSTLDAEEAWSRLVHDGIYENPSAAVGDNLAGEDQVVSEAYDWKRRMAASIDDYLNSLNNDDSELEVIFYEKVAIGDGRYAGNPWLQELPDPISKVVWDNYIAVSPAYASEKNISDGDILKVSLNGSSVSLPAIVQPGQLRSTASIALGYGREIAGKSGSDVGVNVYPLLSSGKGGNKQYQTQVKVETTGRQEKLAQTQHHFSLTVGDFKRPIVKETTLKEYKKDRFSGNTDRASIMEHLDTFYPDRFNPDERNGHHWGMNIDLNSCIGCGACHVACQSENNVPVVGKTEVIRTHEMHWIRIDRYYSGSPENPEVVFQPMLCQHCDNAPCENVCPVAATNHSSEGLNQMAYNRCIGTRYCANNCPYKVRRFNWYDYMGADSFGKSNDKDVSGITEDLTRMVLNPDVTVRSRGVMEKCTFCVQRLQEGKLKAKLENRQLHDGEITTACQSACPSDAISFGDMWDKSSQVYQLTQENERTFGVIEEIHTLPSVTYLTKVRNKDPEDHSHQIKLEI